MDEVETFSIKSLISRKIKKKSFCMALQKYINILLQKPGIQIQNTLDHFLLEKLCMPFCTILNTYLQKSLTLVILIRDALTWCFSVILSLSQKFNLWMSSSLFLKYIYFIINLMYRTSVLLVTGSATDPQKVFLLCSSSVFPSNI